MLIAVGRTRLSAVRPFSYPLMRATLSQAIARVWRQVMTCYRWWRRMANTLIQPKEAKLPKLRPNRPLILESILFLLDRAEPLGRVLSKSEIASILFDADCRQLKRCGRPITFDNYSAASHGPVPNQAWHMMQVRFDWSKLGMRRAPWDINHSGYRTSPSTLLLQPARGPECEFFSDSDIDALNGALAAVLEAQTSGASAPALKHPAYREALERRRFGAPALLDYHRLTSDAGLVDVLVHASRYL